MSEPFFIVAIPAEESLKQLNAIRLYFNVNGFRGKVSDHASDSHITLACGTYDDDKQIEELKLIFEKALEHNKQFTIKTDHVTNVFKKANSEKEMDHSWIALAFRDRQLVELSKYCENVLDQYELSTTREYVESIYKLDPSSVGRTIVGDHMNMCMHCVPELAQEAYNKCVNEAPNEIKIGKIAFRYNKNQHAWEIPLKS